MTEPEPQSSHEGRIRQPVPTSGALLTFDIGEERLFADSAPTTDLANCLRFRLSPGAAIALAARVKKLAGKK
jgi:hypothetical protein